MKKAKQIAEKCLRTCYKDDGIVASINHFRDFWARDSLFASWGLLELGEYKKVKSNLELFIKYQKKDGQIARRIDRYFVGLHYCNIRIKRGIPKPVYFGARIFPALDPNLLFVIACQRYANKTDNRKFLVNNYNAIRKAMEWLQKFEQDSLLHEKGVANWMDTVIKNGAVLYSNVLYVETLSCFSKISTALKDNSSAKKYMRKHTALKEEINQKFWNGHYYIDWIGKKKKYDYFSTDGNLLAMLFGIANNEQKKKIISFIEKSNLTEIPMKTNTPSYPWWRVVFWMHFRGTPGYQNNHASWLWLGSIYAVCLHDAGKKKRAQEIQKKIASKIEEYKTVYETYEPIGQPYKGWLWRNTKSFTWSAALFLWAESLLSEPLQPKRVQHD